MVAQNTPMLKFVRYSFSKGYEVHRRLDLILLDVPYDVTQVIAHRFAVVEHANGNEAIGVLLENLLHRILSHMRLDATVVNEIDGVVVEHVHPFVRGVFDHLFRADGFDELDTEDMLPLTMSKRSPAFRLSTL
jgi:hypothetical protein